MICSDMTAPPSTVDDDPAAWGQAVLRRQVERLEALAETGLALAQRIAQADIAAPADVAMAFSRVSRAVRLACLLQARLIKDADEARREADDQRRTQDDRDRIDANQARRDRKARVEAIVERVAWTETEDEDRTESLLVEAAERLDSDDIYGDVLNRPLGELVALICRDLGLEPDWDGLAQEAWALDEIARGDPGSPFAAPAAGENGQTPQDRPERQDLQDRQEPGGGPVRRPAVPFHQRL
jgi:hypothetical protein